MRCAEARIAPGDIRSRDCEAFGDILSPIYLDAEQKAHKAPYQGTNKSIHQSNLPFDNIQNKLNRLFKCIIGCIGKHRIVRFFKRSNIALAILLIAVFHLS